MNSKFRVVALLLAGTFLGSWQQVCLAAEVSYLPEQARAGRQDYATYCAACHGRRMEGLHLSPSLVGPRFDQNWRGKSLDILAFHVRRMPNEPVAAPGSLDDETYANILAHILQTNRFEPKDQPLRMDESALKEMELPQLPGAGYDPTAPVEATDAQKELLSELPVITDEMLLDPAPRSWLRWGRGAKGHSFSPLDLINKETLRGLKPAWRAPLRQGDSMAAPLVYDGVMFLHTFPDTVLALDASNGQVLWRREYDGADRSTSKMGLGLHGDRVYVPTSDLHVQALDIKTGELVWDCEIDTRGVERSDFSLRTAPLIVGDRVIQGITATFGARGGFIVGLDRKTGEQIWRFNTIPAPDEPGGDTWNDMPHDERSGGSVWHQGTYDPELNLVYFGVAPTYNTGPLLHPVDKPGVTSDALYTDCTLALNPETGELVWHYQHLRNDQWDLDWAFERQIVDVPFGGVSRKAVINVGKMGIMEALDAATGKYLFSVDTGVQDIITHIDPTTGEKTIDPEKVPNVDDPCVVCPSAIGARSWPPTSFSPNTDMVYVPLNEMCMTLGEDGMRLLSSGVRLAQAVHPDAADGTIGRLQAIDTANQKLAWTHDQEAPLSTGVLSTGGGLVFVGDMEPSLKAFDDATGDLLWRTDLDDLPSSGLISYSVGDTQYIAVLVGVTNLHINGLQNPEGGYPFGFRRQETGGGAAIWAFALDPAEADTDE